MKQAKAELTRETLVARLRRRLLLQSAPRFEMSLIVGATASFGFLASRGLLAIGLHSLALRYASAVALAYVGFLLLVWIWLLLKSDRLDPDVDAEDAADVVDTFSTDAPPDSSDSTSDIPLGEFDVAGDELAIVVALAAATCAGLVSAFYVVYTAPALLAEVLLDGALSYGLYRRLRRVDRRHWLESAVRRTWVPAAAVAVSFVVAGAVMHWYAPEASSIGEVWQHVLTSK